LRFLIDLKPLIAEIIAVGSEMLTPYGQDTYSLFLTGALNDLGISVAFKTIVGDNSRTTYCRRAVSAAGRADLILIMGGLGPRKMI